MRETDVLDKIIALNNTLCEAFQYIQENLQIGTGLTDIIKNFENGVESVLQNAVPMLDGKRGNSFQMQTARLRRACGGLIGSPKSSVQFAKDFSEWENLFSLYIHIKAINLAAHCKAPQARQMVPLLEQILACPFRLNPQIKSLADFSMSQLLRKEEPRRSYELGIEAFEENPKLCESILKPDARFHNYVYRKVDEIHFHQCPSCGGNGTPYYAALLLRAVNYDPMFSPVKLWMKCDCCGQLFAYNFPRALVEPQTEKEELGDESYMDFRPQYLPVFCNILKKAISYSGGKKLLEVGAGTGELIAAALELGCHVEAVEISKRQSRRIQALLGIPVHCMDFLDFDTSQKFDFITMGDVVEHVTKPVDALKKAHGLLKDNGVLWISTPNFESGFSRLLKFNDPMWNEPYHFSYFSYRVFQKMLSENGFQVKDYSISQRYNGSMEIFATRLP